MATLDEICAELGFFGSSRQYRASPNILKQDLSDHSDLWFWLKNVEELTQMFLRMMGPKHFGATRDFESQPDPIWHPDNKK